jgi:hypothetical protein
MSKLRFIALLVLVVVLAVACTPKPKPTPTLVPTRVPPSPTPTVIAPSPTPTTVPEPHPPTIQLIAPLPNQCGSMSSPTQVHQSSRSSPPRVPSKSSWDDSCRSR